MKSNDYRKWCLFLVVCVIGGGGVYGFVASNFGRWSSLKFVVYNLAIINLCGVVYIYKVRQRERERERE